MKKQKEASAQPASKSGNAAAISNKGGRGVGCAAKSKQDKPESGVKVLNATKNNDKAIIAFNPLKKEVLGGAIAQVLLTTKIYRLDQTVPFNGAGIYALYYTGDFPLYAKISAQNKAGRFRAPIYVGQALPAGGRTGLKVTVESAALKNRLSKHRLSIREAENLRVEDFYYRALVLDDAFIRLGESSLIALFSPIWNSYLAGFGNNAPGGGRTPIKSRWDSMHPGRKQARKHDSRDAIETLAQIESEIAAILRVRGRGVPKTLIYAEGQSQEPGLSSVSLERVINEDMDEPEQQMG